MNAYEPCPSCGGSGMQDRGDWVGECSECGGDCMVRARDSRGRFVSASTVKERAKSDR